MYLDYSCCAELLRAATSAIQNPLQVIASPSRGCLFGYLDTAANKSDFSSVWKR